MAIKAPRAIIEMFVAFATLVAAPPVPVSP